MRENHLSLPAVDIVTVTYNSLRHLATYAEALGAVAYPPSRLRVFLVDNASGDGTLDRLRSLGSQFPLPVTVIARSRNGGFGAACNEGAAGGEAPFILFLNPDARPAPEMLAVLAGRATEDPRIGLIDAAQEPVEIPKWRDEGTDYTDWCSGAALLARRAAFDQLGGFDPFFFLYAEDVDLSWRMWLAGWSCVYETRGRVWHAAPTPDQEPRAIESHYAVRYSFAMRLIYDSARGFATHLLRGGRYLGSPRTHPSTRRAVALGMTDLCLALPHLLRRRFAAQRLLRTSLARERVVFAEWYYGRWRS